MNSDFFHDHEKETLPRGEIESLQRSRLEAMLGVLSERNPFYRDKFRQAGWDNGIRIDEWRRLPFTTKEELLASAADNPPYGSNLTYPLEDYIRLHHTSGTSGKPLVVLDTNESWEAWKECWCMILRAAGVEAGDRIFVAFSFGPFVGFWAGYEAGPRLGCRMLTGGGQSSLQRLRAIYDHQATILVCTPSYALHLAEVAHGQGIDVAGSPIRITIHAGEPGASIGATKKRIEQLWGARCMDHIGASEVGPYGFECHRQPGGVHINELDFICECIDPESLRPTRAGEIGELVLTNLNRWGFPVIRYRTGDLVRLTGPDTCSCGRSFRMLMGGILSRADDMLTIRGVNIFPSAIEAVLREFNEVAEFEGQVYAQGGLDQLLLRVELFGEAAARSTQLKTRIEEELRNRLGLRIDVDLAEPGSLPRYELKARRFKRRAGD